MVDTIIYNVFVVTLDRVDHGYVTIGSDGHILKVAYGDAPEIEILSACHKVDGHGAFLMAGVIDCHVHFREPGLTHKATIASESRAAVAGGVTSYCDMPNTVPQTVSMELVEEKISIAEENSLANFSFFIGATNDNLKQLLDADYTRVAGIKLFMGSSTGNMLVDSEYMLRNLFENAPAIISVHAEDESIISRAKADIQMRYGDNPPIGLHTRSRPAEACYAATSKAVDLARKYNTRLHIAHLTTKAELALLDKNTNPEHKRITAEVSPHHLLWTEDDYDNKGSRIKMNPSVKTAEDREALRRALVGGVIDMVATDHAPHLMSEKQGSLFKAASGAPMIQFSLLVMLDLFDPMIVTKTMSYNPAKLFGIENRGNITPGYKADLVLVDRLAEPWEVNDSDVLSLCGWTPVNGMKLNHRVAMTWVNGNLVYDRGAVHDDNKGELLKFQH